MCSLSLADLHASALGALEVLASEFELKSALKDFDPWFEGLRRLPGSVVTDTLLKSLGEPQRVMLHLD